MMVFIPSTSITQMLSLRGLWPSLFFLFSIPKSPKEPPPMKLKYPRYPALRDTTSPLQMDLIPRVYLVN